MKWLWCIKSDVGQSNGQIALERLVSLGGAVEFDKAEASESAERLMMSVFVNVGRFGRTIPTKS